MPAAALVACHGALLALGDLAATPWATLTILALGFAAWGLCAMQCGDAHLDPGFLLGVALVLRGLLIPLEPTLSDDVLRYVWDGRVATAGFDPYRIPPESEALAALRDERWEVMPHKHVATVYPPVALAVFAGAAATPNPIPVLKIILVVADLLACWLLIRLCSRLGLPSGRATLYAWNPLATVEIAGSGHVDALVVLFSVAAVLGLVRRRSTGAGLFAAAGVLAKVVPVFLLPLWSQRATSRRHFALAAGIPLAAVTVILAGWPPTPLPGLVTYGVSWEFAGPIYEPLWRTLDVVEAVPRVKAALDTAKERTGHHELWNRVYPFVYPQLLAKALLGVAFAGFLAWVSVRERDPVAGSGRVMAALVLAAATVYPWYLLWVLPWAALRRHRAWLVASATVSLAYLPLHTDLEVWPWFHLLIWAPVLMLLPTSRWSSA